MLTKRSRSQQTTRENSENPINVSGEEGQSLFEFVLLLMVIIGLSFMLKTGVNRAVFLLWENYIEIIAPHSDSTINLIN